MTTKYSKEFKDGIIARLLQPGNTVAEIATETGIPRDTLYTWKARYRNLSVDQLSSMPGKSSCRLSSDEKLAAVIETASLNETEISEYCRRKGLYPEQINGWKALIVQGLSSRPSAADRKSLQEQAKTIKELQLNVLRKDKALAEAAALLILEKKIQSIFSKSAVDEKSACGSAAR